MRKLILAALFAATATAALAGPFENGAAAFKRGDSFMRTVQAYTPSAGDLSEQFDRATGAQTSAKHLAWSYAAFITAAASRRQAARAIRG